MNYSKSDEALVVALQNNLPLESRPFLAVAKAAGLTETKIIDKLKHWKSEKAVRRIGAFLNHYKTGLSANAMVAWIIPSTKVESTGSYFASQPEITHCYERQIHPDWPYNVYTMVHASSKNEITELVKKFSDAVSEKTFTILYSLKEHKKSATQLFMEKET